MKYKMSLKEVLHCMHKSW